MCVDPRVFPLNMSIAQMDTQVSEIVSICN